MSSQHWQAYAEVRLLVFVIDARNSQHDTKKLSRLGSRRALLYCGQRSSKRAAVSCQGVELA
eukprot:4053208-Alexandrium_andersonii.AAC.1